MLTYLPCWLLASFFDGYIDIAHLFSIRLQPMQHFVVFLISIQFAHDYI